MKLIKCKVVRSFGFHQNFELGDIREFTADQVQKYKQMLEPVDSRSFADRKPDKAYKGGRRKSRL
nr:hypothetical protein 15 [Elusimicrobiota bacterium]